MQKLLTKYLLSMAFLHCSKLDLESNHRWVRLNNLRWAGPTLDYSGKNHATDGQTQPFLF